MYGALYRALPGPAWLRVIMMLVLFAAVLTACALWIFPWVDGIINKPAEVTVGMASLSLR